LARCYQEGGSEAEAHSVLSDLLSRVKSDRDAEAAKGELAELSVKLGKGEQAIVLAEDLLKTSRDPALRRRCHQTLAAAHLAAKDFEKAASAITAAGAGLGGPPK